MTDSDPRLEVLETKLAFQEDTIAKLSDALVAQQARIDRLEARIAQLVEELRAQHDAGDAASEPPPHY